jgi:peptidoglycan/xylan/chitin deacetylase (PgdA/CDA1 family)
MLARMYVPIATRWRRSAAVRLSVAGTGFVLGLVTFAGLASGQHTGTEASRDAAVPILMYHVVSDPPASAPFPELYVSSRDFAGQMRWLDRRGYTAVTLHEVWDSWQHRGRLPERPIVVTFDDGYRSIATNAAPVLRAHSWPGVLNLDASNIDAAAGFGEDRIAQLLRAGWELNSHTLTHPDLTTLDIDSLRREVFGSRKLLRSMFHAPVDFFCYPSGRHDARVVAAVRSAGYLGATTTLYGLASPDDPYRLARVRVNRRDGVGGFAAKLVELERR